MAKFEKGDRVVIVGYQDGVHNMRQEIGKTNIIESFVMTTEGHEWYSLKDNPYYWAEVWLEPLDKHFEIEENELNLLLKE